MRQPNRRVLTDSVRRIGPVSSLNFWLHGATNGIARLVYRRRLDSWIARCAHSEKSSLSRFLISLLLGNPSHFALPLLLSAFTYPHIRTPRVGASRGLQWRNHCLTLKFPCLCMSGSEEGLIYNALQTYRRQLYNNRRVRQDCTVRILGNTGRRPSPRPLTYKRTKMNLQECSPSNGSI